MISSKRVKRITSFLFLRMILLWGVWSATCNYRRMYTKHKQIVFHWEVSLLGVWQHQKWKRMEWRRKTNKENNAGQSDMSTWILLTVVEYGTPQTKYFAKASASNAALAFKAEYQQKCVKSLQTLTEERNRSKIDVIYWTALCHLSKSLFHFSFILQGFTIWHSAGDEKRSPE